MNEDRFKRIILFIYKEKSKLLINDFLPKILLNLILNNILLNIFNLT